MPLVVYQIGDIPVFHLLKGIDNSGVKVDLSRKWQATSTKVVGASGSVLSTDPTRAISDTSSLSLSGNLVFENGENPQNIINRIHSFGGLPNIPIIAFYYQEAVDVNQLSLANVELTWLYTNGLIEETKIGGEYFSESDIHNFNKATLDLNIRVAPYWRALDKLDWEYRKDRVRNPLENVSGGSGIALLPTNPSQIITNNFFYRWSEGLDIFDTDLWGARFDNGERGGVGQVFTNEPVFTFYEDPNIWNVAPVSIYAFTDLPLTGIISIQTERPLLHFMGASKVTNTASLNLSSLNTALINAGLLGILSSDVIITGMASPFPGFIMRYNNVTNLYETISELRPEWVYTGAYPGETGLGQNTITISLPTANSKAAQLHSFGVY